MLKLIKNELTKIFKRKNIYILLTIGILIIIAYNLFEKITNSNMDISKQYQRAYNNDKMLLENYDELNIDESYEEIEERIKLEEYAINNKIKYNIFLNTENKNAPLPSDARILLMKIFNNFDIIIIFILIYLSTTIITEECSNGTIKYLLIKPHTRVKILFSKIITSILIIITITSFITVFQYLLGGILFGFNSYSLEAIIYNSSDKIIETTSLANYMITLIISKIPMYFILSIISLLFGVVTNNIALNILISLGMYLVIYNYDISKYLYSSDVLLNKYIIIFTISIIILLMLLTVIFKKKDIKNMWIITNRGVLWKY